MRAKPNTASLTGFDAYDVSIQLVREIRAPLEEITRKDGDLGRQIRRSVASIPLNITEGRKRAGRDRQHHWRIAAGSANEVLAALDVAQAFGYLHTDVSRVRGLLDRELAMLWRMTR